MSVFLCVLICGVSKLKLGAIFQSHF